MNLMKYQVLLPIVFIAVAFPATANEVRTVRVTLSADSENDGYEAWRAMDGDSRTLWHTQFDAPPRKTSVGAHPIRCWYDYVCGYDHHWQTVPAPDVHETGETTSRVNNPPLPHELRIDLGGLNELRGFVYVPRGGNDDTGTVREYGFQIFDTKTNDADVPVFRRQGVFEGRKKSYRVEWGKPVRGNRVKFVALSSRNGGSHTSVAELQLLADGMRFIALDPGSVALGARIIDRIPNAPDDPARQERIDEWNLSAHRFQTPAYWRAIENEVYDRASLIRPEDRDPVDVVQRRLLAMIRDLGVSDEYEQKLTELAERSAKTDATETRERFDLFLDFCRLRRQVMLADPVGPLKTKLSGVKELLFVKRHRSNYRHMCDQFYGRTQRPGGGLYLLDLSGIDPDEPDSAGVRLKDLLKDVVVQNGRLKGRKLEGGSFLAPDLSFDGRRIVFAYVECEGPADHYPHHDNARGHWDAGRCYHIFRCNVDGSDLCQLTDGTWNDFDPCWMPSGRVAFVSERRNGYLRCGRECPTYTLFDMNADGTKMRCLSYHETNEWHPSVTHDGKILYTRWDYVDRYGCIVHHPWLTTPDGRDPRQVHGNYSHRHRRADAEFDCRAVPGSPKYMATGGPHHGQSFGSLVMIDPRVRDDDAMAPVKRITPEIGFPESQGGGEVFGTPWPLDEKYFLCVADFAFQPGAGIPGAKSSGGAYPRGNDGIYLCDVYGNRELLYRDPEIAAISPIPFVSRPSPPILVETIPHDEIEEQTYVGLRGEQGKKGTLSLVNVYDSLRPFPKDVRIKELRIIQLLPMTTPSRVIRDVRTGIQEASSLDSVNLARAVLGTVPVEEDGSAHFELPAQIEVQFQALDENGLAVQSMRSSSYLQPGEHLSCNGCHEPKTNTPARARSVPKAFKRAASTVKPETVPGARPFSYPLLVQPVLDKHCVECHARPESKTFSLAKDPVQDRFYGSYNNLAPKYGFTNYGDPLRTTPGRFGAAVSPLYRLLRKGHYDVKLSGEEMHRIVLWLDCLSNFYGVYEEHGRQAQLRGEVAWPTLE